MLGILIKHERLLQNMNQAALCEGICTVSYLSKIENGQSECSSEIYRLLFDVLGIEFIEDEKQLAQFSQMYASFMRALRHLEQLPDQAQQKRLLLLCGKIKYSPLGINAVLLEFMLNESLNKNQTKEEAEKLAFFKPFLNHEQLLLYYLGLNRYYSNRQNYAKAALIMEQALTHSEPCTYALLAKNLRISGSYAKSIANGEEAYRLFSAKGIISGMLFCALEVAASYSNSNNNDAMRHWYGVAANINSSYKSELASVSIAYNLGATLLMHGNYEEAIEHLQQALEFANATNSYADVTHQKLAFALALCGKNEEALYHAAKINNSNKDSTLHISVKLIEYMAANPAYEKSRQYCDLLENCFYSAQQQAPRGKMEFFGHYLLQAYKNTRQYKKYISLSEEFNIS